MVNLSDATIRGGSRAQSSSEGVLNAAEVKKGGKLVQALTDKDVDTGALREVRERFPEFGHVDAFVRLVNGQSLFTEIKKKKIETAALSQRIPTSWWTSLRLKWQRAISPEFALTVKNPSDIVPGALITALGTATSPNTRVRSPTPLISWLTSCSQLPSQKAIVGLFRHSLSQHPSGKHLSTVVTIMKLCARLHSDTTYRPEHEAMISHWDQALCGFLGQLSRAGLKDETFLEQNVDIAGLVLSAQNVKVVQQARDVRSCSSELKQLCSSSALGQRLYGQALALLCQREYVAELDVLIQRLLTEVITDERLAEAYTAAEAAAAKWEYDARCKSKSTVEAGYNGLDLTLTVEDAKSVAASKFLCHVKWLGVRRGLVTPLWFEREIFELEQDDIVNPPAISENIIGSVNLARTMINEEASLTTPATGDVALELLKNKLPALEQIDTQAQVEVALCKALTSGPGQLKLNEKMMRCLPDRDRVITLAQSLTLLEKLMETSLFRFASVTAQSTVGEVVQAIKTLCRGQPPCFTAWGGCQLLKRMRDEILPLFCMKEEGFNLNTVEHVRGKAAAALILEACRTKAADDSLDLSAMAPLCQFDWLLDEQEQAEVQTWLKEIWAQAGIAGCTMAEKARKRAPSSLSSSLPEAPGLKKKKKINGVAAQVDNVANLFV